MMSPTAVVLMLSVKTSRWRRPTRWRSSRKKSVEIVMTPRPPIWISTMMTVFPKADQ